MKDETSTVERAAGGIVIRDGRVLVVHRPKYDDWSFPKGGLDDGETTEQAAIREVLEETGLGCRILSSCGVTRYSYRTKRGFRPKEVHYFLMEAETGSEQPDGHEVDIVEWVEADRAASRLTYDAEADLLRRVIGEGGRSEK